MSRSRIMLPNESGSDIRTDLHYDESEGLVIANRIQDVEPYLERNKKRFNSADKHFDGEIFNSVADIPLVVVEKWLREEGLDIFNPDHSERLRRKLNDPEYRYLRTRPGRV